jgi:hypothetical protein
MRLSHSSAMKPKQYRFYYLADAIISNQCDIDDAGFVEGHTVVVTSLFWHIFRTIVPVVKDIGAGMRRDGASGGYFHSG